MISKTQSLKKKNVQRHHQKFSKLKLKNSKPSYNKALAEELIREIKERKLKFPIDKATKYSQ